MDLTVDEVIQHHLDNGDITAALVMQGMYQGERETQPEEVMWYDKEELHPNS